MCIMQLDLIKPAEKWLSSIFDLQAESLTYSHEKNQLVSETWSVYLHSGQRFDDNIGHQGVRKYKLNSE